MLVMAFAWVSCADDRIGDNLKTISIFQELNISSESWNNMSFTDSEMDVKVTSVNISWKFEEVPDWLEITPLSGDKNEEITVNFKLNPDKTREATVYLCSSNAESSVRIPIKVTQAQNQKLDIKAVDLGLSIKWADMNLGSQKNTDPGYYFAWGETNNKSSYSWRNYKYGKGNYAISKYCLDSKYGTVDNDSVLDVADDAVSYHLGEDWRMPTAQEFMELIDNCTWQKMPGGFYRGYSKVEGFTDKYIDIAFNGYYLNDDLKYDSDRQSVALWTSSTGVASAGKAFSCFCSESSSEAFSVLFDRCTGLPVRPVTSIRESDITGFVISRESVTLAPDEITLIDHTVSVGSRTTDVFTVDWKSSDTCIAVVDSFGVVKGVSQGVATITASIGDHKVQCRVTVINPVPEYVDLGLSTRWATFNLGASVPEGSGCYFAWGETSPKEIYSWETYKYYDNKILKYNYDPYYGVADNKMYLDPSDDAATGIWGTGWSMPSYEMIIELYEKCEWTETELNGVKGFRVRSTVPGYESKSIFIPCSGYCYDNFIYHFNNYGFYWSNELSIEYWSFLLFVYDDNTEEIDWQRCLGLTVRPVCNFTSDDITGLVMDNESGYNLATGSSLQLNANAMIGTRKVLYDLEWESTNPEVATVSPNGLVATHHTGNTVIKAIAGNYSVTCSITVVEPEPQYVDLGLSVLWASFNLGSLEPAGDGGYYAWGETETKDSYDWSTYKWGDYDYVTKYNTIGRYGLDGFVDSLLALKPEDDAACVYWGDNWRMPGSDEWNELIDPDNCTWEWVDNYESTGKSGYKVISKVGDFAGAYIFLPCKGYCTGTMLDCYNEQGRYFSRDLYTTSPLSSYYIYFNKEKVVESVYYRNEGYSIRPVKPIGPTLFSSLGFDGVADTIKIDPGKQYQLVIKGSYGDGKSRTIKADKWETDNPKVASVSENGLITGVLAGCATITATCLGMELKCVVSVNDLNDYVDLGLSVCWSVDAIGYGGFIADPDHYDRSYFIWGDAFAWGEVKTKSDYSWNSYLWSKGANNNLTKYCTASSYGYNGYADVKNILEPEDDAAHVLWGGDWRMPTEDEVMELIDNCNWNFESNMYGVWNNGYNVVSKMNGKTIVFEDYSGFWTSTLSNENTYYSSSLQNVPYTYQALMLSVRSSNGVSIKASDRCVKNLIRPVKASPDWKGITTFVLNTDNLSVEVGCGKTLTPTIRSGDKDYKYHIQWKSSDYSIAAVNANGVVTGVKPGKTIITAICHGKSTICNVTVTE